MFIQFKKNIATILVIVGSLFCDFVQAQPLSSEPDLTSISNTIAGIYKSYDSIPYITFDIKYVLSSSDTLDGDTLYDALQGTYTMAGNRALYKLGDIDFMQNDSFLISVYNNEKFIVVSDPVNHNVGMVLPMRNGIDSLISAYGEHYTISASTSMNEDSASIGSINFLKADSLAQFETFTIGYDVDQKLLLSIEYTFKENDYPANEADTAGPSLPVLRLKKFRIDFSNYRFENFSNEIYNENNYIFFEKGVYRPIDKYSNYKIYLSRRGNSDSVDERSLL